MLFRSLFTPAIFSFIAVLSLFPLVNLLCQNKNIPESGKRPCKKQKHKPKSGSELFIHIHSKKRTQKDRNQYIDGKLHDQRQTMVYRTIIFHLYSLSPALSNTRSPSDDRRHSNFYINLIIHCKLYLFFALMSSKLRHFH